MVGIYFAGHKMKLFGINVSEAESIRIVTAS